MSRELMKALFERDLSTDEMDQIAASLRDDQDDAAFFALLALAHYQSLGLKPPKMPRKGAWKLWGGIGVGLVVAGLWGAWPQAQQVPEMPVPVAPTTEAQSVEKPALAEQAIAKPKATATRFDEGDAMRVEVELPLAMHVQVDLFDGQGKRLRTLFNGESPQGANSYGFDGLDKNGVGLAPGRYRVVVDYGGGELEKWFELK